MALLPQRIAAWRFDLIEVVYRKNKVVTLRRHPDYLPPSGSDVISEILARRPFWGYII